MSSNAGNENETLTTRHRSLQIATLANAVLWILSIIALIIVLQRAASPRGLFVILAAGLATSLAIISVVRTRI